MTVFGTASRNESRHQVPAFLAQASDQARQAFAAGKLPLPAAIQHKILAHGISSAFPVGVVFAAVALLVCAVSIQSTDGDLDPDALTGVPG